MESGVSDLGTPSAPPIMDGGIEEKSFQAESEYEEAFRGSVDIDKTGNGPRFSENSEVIEDTADWGASEIYEEVGERYFVDAKSLIRILSYCLPFCALRYVTKIP